VLFVLAGVGLYPAVQRQYVLGGDRDARKLLTVSVVAAALVTALADLTGPRWADFANFASYDGPVRLAVLWAGASAVTNCALALLRSRDSLFAFGTVSLLQSVVAAVTSLLLVSVEGTAEMFLTGQLLVQIVAALVALILVTPRMPRLADGALVKAALAFGLPLVPAVLCTYVLQFSDRLIVQAEMGSAAVAQYQVAYNLGAMPTLLLGILNASWLPRIFALEVRHERSAVIATSRDLLYMLIMPVIVGLALGAPIVLRVWAPPSYRPEDLLLVHAVVLVSAIPYTACLASTRTLLAEGRTAFIAIAQALAATVNVLLNLTLIPPYGLEGSASATLISYAGLSLLLTSRANAIASVAPPRGRLQLALIVSAAIALASAVAPAEGSALLMRTALVLVTLAWFALALRKTRSVGAG
jgi:O-antigen/teichoic acid export membrane protein